MDRNEVVRLTERYGGEWLVHHAERLLRLIEIVGEGLPYHREAIWLICYLHDWGSCPRWVAPGRNHSARGREVAERYLKRARCPKDLRELILTAIEFHHGGGENLPIEAILLRDADALDGLGALGVAKQLAMLPTIEKGMYSTPSEGMGLARDRAEIWRENNPRLLALPRSRQLAEARLQEMDRLLAVLQQESFGYL